METVLFHKRHTMCFFKKHKLCFLKKEKHSICFREKHNRFAFARSIARASMKNTSCAFVKSTTMLLEKKRKNTTVLCEKGKKHGPCFPKTRSENCNYASEL